MTDDRSIERAARSWLEMGPTQAPERAVEAALLLIDTTPQERDWHVPWRLPTMTTPFRVGAAAFVGVIAIAGGLYLLTPGSSSHAGGPAPSPESSPSHSPSASAAAPEDLASWLDFTSDRYGYDIKYPVEWTSFPSERDFVLDVDVADGVATKAADGWHAPGSAYFSVFAVPVAAGTSPDAWIAGYRALVAKTAVPCEGPPQPTSESVVVDGQPATLASICGDTQAFVFRGDRVYVFSIWRAYNAPLLKDFLSTVRFHPDGPSASPAAS